MRINEKLIIPEDNPFQNDILDREKIADNLEAIIGISKGSLVLSIDSGWGKGKTTFINMWRKKLQSSDKYKTLYFNAWENDDSEDSLLSLVAEMEETLFAKNLKDATLQRIKTTSKALLKKSVPIALKIATQGLLDLEKVNLGESTEKGIAEIVGKLGEIELKNYKSQKIAKTKFKEALTEYQMKENKKIIFFIDELDRCRPTYAIETLERIKHLFDIDNYIFILALDKEQLAYSIQTLYGQKMDSVGYLRRFIDIEFKLPEPDRETFTELLLEKYQLKNNKTKHFENYLKLAIESHKLSLRDIEKLFLCLRLVIPRTQLFDSEEKYKAIYLQTLGVVYSIFPVLKIKHGELFDKFVKKEYNSSEILDAMRVNQIDEKIERTYYKDTITKIISLNQQLGKNDINWEHYSIGPGENNDPLFNYTVRLSFLLANDKELKFIKELEFTEKFSL